MFALLSSDSQHANVCSPKLIQRCSVLNMYTRFMFIVFDNCAQNLWPMFFLQRIYIIDFQKYNKNPYLYWYLQVRLPQEPVTHWLCFHKHLFLSLSESQEC